MQLFAIIAKVDELREDDTSGAIRSSKGKSIVELFLRQELNATLVNEYLLKFNDFLTTHHGSTKKKDGKRKRTSVNSVKILRICSQINEELTRRQKIIVVVRLLEFINANDVVTEQEHEFVTTVAETFNVSMEEYNAIKVFVESDKAVDVNQTLYLTNTKENTFINAKQIYVEGLDEMIRIIHVESVNMFFLHYLGKEVLTLNGQVVPNDRQHIFTQGSSLKTPKINTVYYSDIISKFLTDENREKITFNCNNVVYKFKGGKIGLQNIDFKENNGKLLGIMGGSGAGKSTLLNVLNGNYKPTEGKVTINGIDIHNDKDQIEGVIGFVSQDDLLIEELTVFQNLYFNAKLCFKELSNSQVAKKVLHILNSIGLYDSKDLKVGNPLDKTISGGQRKRLNIALELIREPSVLFVDEPTSGLSSRDSENIMDLLKELALKGKLVYVVIHQPSSDIFKMFDKLMILDMGGYPIFYGNPVDGVVHFKTLINHVNCEERECETCGNVNPEQIFNIIEAKVVDEYGNLTSNRKTTAQEWNKKYIEMRPKEEAQDYNEKPNISFQIPSKIKQFIVYFKRDVLAKFTNKQYILINLIEAPLLALILAFFVKFFEYTPGDDTGFTFSENENLPQFLFISVVVALFIGLTVAAEEIIKDRKILKRESFLNLSKGSYLFSKISIMFLISAVQMLFFVLVGNFVLEIKGMWFEYWAILFSTSCFANLLGLNISSTFDNAKVIYILIPVMIIPQLLFSGVIVKFDKLNPIFSQEDSVPWIGNVMASRWAYEALAVTQHKHNDFQAPFFALNSKISTASWKRDYWIPDLKNRLDIIQNNIDNPEKKESVAKAFKVLKTEIAKEEAYYDPNDFSCINCIEGLKTGTVTKETRENIHYFLEVLRKQYNADVNDAMQAVELKIKEIGEEKYKTLKDNHLNKSLADFVTNRNELKKKVEKNGRLIQKDDPIYLSPTNKSLLDAHFYAPNKKIFGTMVDTFNANLLVIWIMTILLTITLYFDAFRNLIKVISR